MRGFILSREGFFNLIFNSAYVHGMLTMLAIVAIIWFCRRFKNLAKIFYVVKGGFSDACAELAIIFSSSKNTDEGTLENISRAANHFQFRLQKLIFLGLIFILCLKGFFEILQSVGIFSQNLYELRSSHAYVANFLEMKTLVYVAAALAISCGIQLAYMLITDGPDEAVEPLMLGIASTILLILSDSNAQNWTSDRSFAVIMLVVCIPILFACSRWMERVRKDKK